MNFERILVIRPDGLGDLVCALPALEALRAAYPSAKITVLASPLNAPLLEGHPSVFDVVMCDRRGVHKGVIGLYWIARTLRAGRFDVAFAFRTATYAHLIAGVSGAPIRVGYADKPLHNLLTHTRRGGHAVGEFHESERNLRLLELAGVPITTSPPKLRLSREERDFAAHWLANQGVAPDRFLIGVHPGASSANKQVPVERFAQAATAVSERARHATVLAFAGLTDYAAAKRLTEATPVESVIAESLSVRQMMALLGACDLALVNDSGPMHVAAALGLPLVAVFGPTDHVRWRPLGSPVRVVHTNQPDAPLLSRRIDAIPAEAVIDAALDLYDELANA